MRDLVGLERAVAEGNVRAGKFAKLAAERAGAAPFARARVWKGPRRWRAPFRGRFRGGGPGL
eukprot:11209956-Lingulodinium_polyedra.AAC.1